MAFFILKLNFGWRFSRTIAIGPAIGVVKCLEFFLLCFSFQDGTWSDLTIGAPPTTAAAIVGDSGNAPFLRQQQSYLIRNLEPDTTYEAQLAAKNRFGWGLKSEAFRFHTRSEDEGLLAYSSVFRTLCYNKLFNTLFFPFFRTFSRGSQRYGWLW